MLDPSQLHYVYRFYDDGEALLYVGESADPGGRAQSHANTKAWWPEVADVTTEAFLNASLAKEEERRAIREELPRYNVVGRPRPFVRGMRADEREQRRARWWAETRPDETPPPRRTRRHDVAPRRPLRTRAMRYNGRPDAWPESLYCIAYVCWRLFIRLPMRITVRITVRDIWPSSSYHGGRTLARLRAWNQRGRVGDSPSPDEIVA